MLRAFKTYPSTQKMNVAVGHYKRMPPSGICSGREKADNALCVSLVYFFHRLGYPAANFTAIRGIHPTYSMPTLYQAVGCWRKKRPALGIFPSGAHIQGKRPVRNIPHVEQFPRRCPLHFFTGEMHVHKDKPRVFPRFRPLSCATPFCKAIPTCRFTSSSPRDWCRSLKSVSPLARSSSVKIGATTLPPTS